MNKKIVLREYETIYILKPELDDKNAKDFMKNIKTLIQDEGGTSIKVSCMGRRKLAWTRKKYERGIFVHHRYTGNNTIAKKVSKNLTINEKVILQQTIKLNNLFTSLNEENDDLHIYIINKERETRKSGIIHKNKLFK